MKFWSAVLLIPLSLFAFQTPEPEVRLHELREVLQHRIRVQDFFAPDIPPIFYQAALPANARYEEGKIIVGSIQTEYQTTEDSLSILYHEYHHHIQALRGEYVICEDSSGNIPQWSTGEMYLHIPDSAEIEREMKQALGPWIERYEEPRRSKEMGRLKRDLSRPRKILFVYAPSRLAEAEVDAYQAQLRGETLGLYQLSRDAKAAILRRLDQLEETLQRRRTYEQQHALPPDACEK